jgi:hypothetical protein
LEYVGDALDLRNTKIETLGNLNYVDFDLYLDAEYIKTLDSLGDLEYVGGDLYWEGCDYNIDEIEEVVWVEGQLYL